jgi:hypothetical protein
VIQTVVSVADFIEAVVADFNADRHKPVPSFIGKRFVNQNDAPPILAPVRVGAHLHAAWSRSAGLQVGVWGPIEPPSSPALQTPEWDLRGTEEMLRQLLASIRRVHLARFGQATASTPDRPGVVDVTGGEWVEPGEVMTYGMLFVLRLSVRLPVPSAEQVKSARLLSVTATEDAGATELLKVEAT